MHCMFIYNIKKTCSQSSSEVIKEHFQPLIDIHEEQDIQYQTWVYRNYKSQKTGKISRILNFDEDNLKS